MSKTIIKISVTKLKNLSKLFDAQEKLALTQFRFSKWNITILSFRKYISAVLLFLYKITGIVTPEPLLAFGIRERLNPASSFKISREPQSS